MWACLSNSYTCLWFQWTHLQNRFTRPRTQAVLTLTLWNNLWNNPNLYPKHVYSYVSLSHGRVCTRVQQRTVSRLHESEPGRWCRTHDHPTSFWADMNAVTARGGERVASGSGLRFGDTTPWHVQAGRPRAVCLDQSRFADMEDIELVNINKPYLRNKFGYMYDRTESENRQTDPTSHREVINQYHIIKKTKNYDRSTRLVVVEEAGRQVVVWWQ